MTIMERTATTQHVAAVLGVTPSTVQGYSRDHQIPFDTTPGGHRRYNLDEVRTALEARGQTALEPLVLTGLGPGAESNRSAMASLDTQRRAVIGEATAVADHTTPSGAVPALVDLIAHSRRVLVSI